MTKVKLKEATKELNQKAGVILEESARVKRNADALLQSLQKQRAQLQREADEALGKLMTDLGYETYSGSWYLEYTEFFDYFFNCYIDGVDDIKFAFDISGIIFVVVLLLFLVFLSYRKEMVVDDDVILCKRGKKTVKQFMLKDVKSVQNIFLKGIKVKGIGLRYGILLVKNRTEIKKIITDKMAEFATKTEQFIVPASNDTSFDDIRKYKELLDSGIITQEEFDLKKKQILGL